ncbi:hypothetical protein HanXRQr2_Chr03g0106511 [Helianthus annuus]|uniref:Uncharacterized protein n=1 Tax=Helianthus annuus TaxID=4232 RepID=A0A9K3JFN6_HELAN|nr:hypothetical protein HanXRQr2_Chr03g0106511 [Helianthus annuus]KAJ0943339.1 hypothetical protein HanPSC8_Chr03g0103061 [Helianthus annuus]
MCHLMIKYASDLSLNFTRVPLNVPCTNMNLIVGSISNTIHVINEHAYACYILSIVFSVLLECVPYETCG